MDYSNLQQFIMDAISKGLVKGKLNHKQQSFTVGILFLLILDWVHARDVHPDQIKSIKHALGSSFLFNTFRFIENSMRKCIDGIKFEIARFASIC